MRYLPLLALLILTACGGGNSSSPAIVVTPPPQPHRIDFAFFGPSDTAVTAPFTSVYHAVDWGPRTPAGIEAIKLRIIGELQQAKARGIDRFIVSTGFLTLDDQCNYLGNAQLAAFKLQLDALGLPVWMIYPQDEPDVHGCSGATMARVFQDSRVPWGGDVRVGVIYGPNGTTPGIDQATDVGRDNYGHGPQVLSLRADQHLMLVAGGANPYREDPGPYVDSAQKNDVSLVWAFLYVDYVSPQGRQELGIALNGMLQAYRAAGCALTRKCT